MVADTIHGIYHMYFSCLRCCLLPADDSELTAMEGFSHV
jgi:hypothetical protein